MPDREELSKNLFGCLRNVSSLLELARSVALEQRGALVANNAEALVTTCKSQDDIMRRISESDQRAAEIATELARVTGADTGSEEAINSAGLASERYDPLIRNELRSISRLAADLEGEHEINHRLITNGLEIITCCLRTVATETSPPAYSSTAAFSEPQAYVLSLDRKA